MISEDNDLTLRRLRHLAVVEPDPARSERVRARCGAAIASIAERQQQGRRPTASGRFTALVFELGLTYALSLGYLSAMMFDVLRVYMRR
jgi:hypothetical protein